MNDETVQICGTAGQNSSIRLTRPPRHVRICADTRAPGGLCPERVPASSRTRPPAAEALALLTSDYDQISCAHDHHGLDDSLAGAEGRR